MQVTGQQPTTTTSKGHVSRPAARGSEDHRRTQSDVRDARNRMLSRDRRFMHFSHNRQLENNADKNDEHEDMDSTDIGDAQT